MSIIALPDNNFRSVNWTLAQPTQVNRSEFTSARQVMQLGASYWRASADHVPIRGEENVRAWRAFIVKLKGQANSFYLPATEGEQTSFAFPGLGVLEPVTNAAGMSISGRTVTKTGVNTAWDASVRTDGLAGFTAGARISWRAGQTDKNFMIGISQNPNAGVDEATIDHALHCLSDGQLAVVESGVTIDRFGRYTTDDVLSVVYDNASICYYRGGELLHTAAKSAGLTFFADSSFFHPGASANSVGFRGAVTGVAAGDTSLALTGFGASETAALKAGYYATALFYGGGAQLVTITENADADSSGNLTATFEPMLRGVPFSFLTGRPFCQMAMDSSELGYSVDPGALYGFSFSAAEAF